MTTMIERAPLLQDAAPGLLWLDLDFPSQSSADLLPAHGLAPADEDDLDDVIFLSTRSTTP